MTKGHNLSNRCVSVTSSGAPCGMARMRDSQLCWNHDPRVGRQRAEARRRGGRHRRRSSKGAPLPPVELSDVRAIRHVLETAVGETMTLEPSLARARTLAYLVSVALRVIEVGEIEYRLTALESLVIQAPVDKRP